MRSPLFVLSAFLVAFASSAKADEVGINGGKPTISREDCRALVQYRQAPGVEYQPGVDAHGKYVTPADASGGFTYNPPAKVEFNVTINPIQYGQRNTLQAQIAQTQATLATNPNNAAAQQQLNTLQNQMSALPSQFSQTQASVGHVVVDLKSGQATLDGRPLEGAQQHYLEKVCHDAGY